MLSDEEKSRIEEEEAYRAEARLKAEQDAAKAERRARDVKRRNGCMGVLLVGFLLFAIPSFLQSFNESRVEAATREAAEEAAEVAAEEAAKPKAEVTFDSDPQGAWVIVSNQTVGKTPITTEVPMGEDVWYAVEVEEPFEDYDLYKSYTGTLNISENETISVWLERTTAEEQEAQKVEAEEKRVEQEARRVKAEEERAEKRAEAERRACERRLANSPLVLDNWSWYTSSSYAIAEGKVTNQSSSTLKNIEAVVEFKTADGQFITSDSSLLDYTDLLPGQSTPFKVYARFNPAMEKASLSFKKLLGGRVEAVNRSDTCN